MSGVRLAHVELPLHESAPGPPPIAPGEHERRMDELHRRAGAAWVVVYGDREHAANLAFLCGHDPRFEEALLLLGPAGQRVLAVGNEGVSYAAHTSPGVEVVLAQSLSLLGQARDDAPRLDHVLRDAGLSGGDRAGVVGWKYLSPRETDEPQAPAYVPAFVIGAIEAVTGERAFDATSHLMDAESGLRARNGAAQIARFEWAASRAAAAVLRLQRETRPGMTELEAAARLGYAGEVLTCHVMLSADAEAVVGLRSPGGRVIGEGDAVTTAVGYAGGLCSRAGVMLREPDDAFVRQIVAPYFSTLATWYGSVRVGAAGGDVHDAVVEAIGNAPFRSMLNPGHLGSYDEWLNSPIRPGSADRVASGMVFQCDLIPVPMPRGRALNCEDTIAVADDDLRAELAAEHRDLWARVEARRSFLATEIGLDLPPETLPLSDAVAYLAPFWLDPSLVCRRD